MYIIKEMKSQTMKNKISRFYTTDSSSMTDVFVNRLFKVVEHTTVQDPHPGLIIGVFLAMGIVSLTDSMPVENL